MQADTTPDHSLHASFQATTRDLLKLALLPLLADGIAAQSLTTTDGGLALAPCLHFVLHLASIAAEFIGWRDPRVHSAPFLRNYGLVNALWVGVMKCWTAVPTALRPQLSPAGLAAETVALRLADYLCKDVEMLCRRKEPSDVKLLQFWIVNTSKLLSGCPEQAVALTVWESSLRWTLSARAQMRSLQSSTDAAAASAGVVHAVGAGSLWIRAARVQVQALAVMKVETATATIASLTERLRSSVATSSSSGSDGAAAAVDVFSSAVEVLSQSGAMSAPLRCICLPLFKQTLLSLTSAACAAAVATSEQCRSISDSFFSFIASLSSSSSSSSSCSASTNAWEECQLLLMECSIIPHPVMLRVLTMLWSSLSTICDGVTSKHFVSAMNEVLGALAAVEAATSVDTYRPPSPTNVQLTHLLGVLLGSVPVQLAEGFCFRFLVVSPQSLINDRCQLASVAAVLRATALSGRPSCCLPALSIVNQLCAVLKQQQQQQQSSRHNAPYKTAPLPPPTTPTIGAPRDGLYVAWVVDCLGAALECLGTIATEGIENINSTAATTSAEQLELAVTGATQQCLSLLTSQQADATAAFLVPSTLHTLHLAWRLNPTSLQPPDLETLHACLEAFLHTIPAAAAGIACLTPTLCERAVPPKILFEALLGPSASPSLHFLGRDAYVKYARDCRDERCVHSALPRHWIDPGTGGISNSVRPTLEQYLQRIPSGNGNGDTAVVAAAVPHCPHVVCVELEKVAMTAQPRLIEALAQAKTAVAVEAGVCLQQQQQLRDGASSVDTVVGEVFRAVERLQQVWDPATASIESGGGGMVATVKRARDTLTALIS